ncbi:MAG: glutamine--fructose-6-phosphate transaminase (isomerizing) [Rhizobiaceae bacterium]|nr:glutamine--fructose-6-phosphate transaminase (isomerizing) [Rhizobiaceae bacterium]
MCGIVGIVGTRPVAPLIVDALKRLEYRGYDSAGVATIESGVLDRRRAEGKLVNLQDRLDTSPLSGRIGIGHTRWATHGAPIEINAHPHFSGGVAVVHNGIIENFRDLRAALEADGFVFDSQTDTEVVAHLVEKGLRDGLPPEEAAHYAIQKLSGAFALAVMFKNDDNLIVAARNGPPLAIGHGQGEMYLGSDAVALAPFTNRITYLEDGDWAVIRRDELTIFDEHGEAVKRQQQLSVGSALLVDKGNHRHFMLKEIYEQPEVIGHTLANYVDFNAEKIALRDMGDNDNPLDFAKLDRLNITACGTAYLAGYLAKYWFERHARLPVDIDVASEFRYREVPLSKNGLSLFISQSGETADTLAGLKYCEEHGQKLAAIVNVRESTIARSSHSVFPTLAGPEIGVASTKAFTCQLAVLASLAIGAGVQRGHIDPAAETEMVRALAEAPRYANEVLKLEDEIKDLAHTLANKQHVLYLGRDTNYPLAMEGALKLKELSYIHAEAYAAGELKHGPIALIDEEMPVVVIAPHDRIFEKTVSNMQEVAARGGKIILITDPKGAAEVGMDEAKVIVMPEMPEIITPIVYALPIQMLAYHTAVHMGTDVDQPRNLAKSVTVE